MLRQMKYVLFHKETLDAHPDLDFCLMYYIGGNTGQKMIAGFVELIQYIYSQKDTFSYGKDPVENNFCHGFAQPLYASLKIFLGFIGRNIYIEYLSCGIPLHPASIYHNFVPGMPARVGLPEYKL